MYIRKRSHKLKNGRRQLGYGLLENRRVMGMPKQKRILNLGQDFDIPEADWPVLTNRVAATMRGQQMLPLEDEKPVRTAAEIVRRLREKGYDVDAGRDDYDAIITDAVHHIGCAHGRGRARVSASLEATRLCGAVAQYGHARKGYSHGVGAGGWAHDGTRE